MAPAQAVAADGIDALQVPQQLRRRAPLRRRPQVVQGGERRVIGGDQRHELLPLLVGQGAGQAVPKPQGGAMAHAADQALERGDAGQQHLVRQQPGGGPVEQQPRTVVPGPAQHVEPAGQPEAGRRCPPPGRGTRSGRGSARHGASAAGRRGRRPGRAPAPRRADAPWS